MITQLRTSYATGARALPSARSLESFACVLEVDERRRVPEAGAAVFPRGKRLGTVSPPVTFRTVIPVRSLGPGS